MKNLALLLGVLWFSLANSPGQVSVEVTQDQDQFLPGEAMPTAVRITNLSGQPLHLGDEGWLTFSIESRDGFIVVKSGEVPVAGDFTLLSSKRATKRVDLAPYFNLPKTGRYSITATLTVKNWNQQISSAPKPFDVIEGSKMWEQEVGLPVAPGATNQAPELRKYALHQANYHRKHLMLYVQVSDRMGRVNRVFPIGPMLSIGQPKPQVDRISNLHVLYQDGPHSYSYTVIDPDGVVIVRQSYDYTTQPRLNVDTDGNLRVVGGKRRITSGDLPASKLAEENVQPPMP